LGFGLSEGVKIMTTKEIIYKLLYQALIEIREEAYTAKLTKTFHLADLFHNVPLSLEKADDYDELMIRIKKRASEKGIVDWLDNHVSDLTQTK
jgi:hypothetical protein